MIEVNTQQAKREFANLLSEVESQGTTVKIFSGEKVVAEIVPAKSSRYRALNDPHAEQTQNPGYVYRTIGETLSGK